MGDQLPLVGEGMRGGYSPVDPTPGGYTFSLAFNSSAPSPVPRQVGVGGTREEHGQGTTFELSARQRSVKRGGRSPQSSLVPKGERGEIA